MPQKRSHDGLALIPQLDNRVVSALADSQALEADRATVISEQHKIGQLRSLVEQKFAQVQLAHTAPQQVNDAQAKSESSNGQPIREGRYLATLVRRASPWSVSIVTPAPAQRCEIFVETQRKIGARGSKTY
jgi:hypothetical protein